MSLNDKISHEIPSDHPRYESLTYRHKIIDGMQNLIVAEAGLIAHGRGECFDYILGERTNQTAKKAIRAAVAMLFLANHPVISVNGNVAALVPNQLVELSNILKAPLEINLFYRKEGRIEAIKKVLENAGALQILGVNEEEMVEIKELSSNRRKVDPNGIKIADVVFVPLEDGDRTEALKKLGKKVIAIDLNPLSRTSLWADISIIDNIIRALPQMIKISKQISNMDRNQIKRICTNFKNKKNLNRTIDLIINYMKKQKVIAFKKLKQ